MRLAKHNDRLKDQGKNKIHTPSRFFNLKNAQNLPSHYSQNRDYQAEQAAAKNAAAEQLGRTAKQQSTVKCYPATFQGQPVSGFCVNDVSEQTL